MAVKIYPKSSRAMLSKNFSVYEFRCGLSHGCTCTQTMIDEQLVDYLQKIADHFNATVTITSGYRCSAYNKKIGSSTGSRHSSGQAADIVVAGVQPKKVAAYAESIGVKGIGLYETASDGFFVHIDTRTKKAFWYGQKQAYRSTFGGAAAAVVTKPTTSTSTSNSGYTKKQFVKDLQAAIGVEQDGIAGPITLKHTPTLSKKQNISHAAVLCVQKRLIALGYEPGDADGWYGKQTEAAVKKFQKEHGCVADGIITSKNKTWKKLMEMT